MKYILAFTMVLGSLPTAGALDSLGFGVAAQASALLIPAIIARYI